MASLNTYSGTWGKPQVVHLLKRTMFGSPLKDINYFLGKNVTDAVDELLTQPSSKPLPPLNHYEGSMVDGQPFKDADNIPLGQTWVNGTYGDGTTNFLRGESIKAWWLENIFNQNRSIEEKMILFWHSHFVTALNAGGGTTSFYKLLELFRTEALGDYRTLMVEMSRNTFMLHYLNGYLNTKYSPDENFARELQELFGVGKGPGSQYTEEDVRAAARVLTGQSFNWNPQTYVFRDIYHDTDNKVFSSFYGNKTILGKSGAQGNDELEELVDMILATDECAKYICRRIYIFFVDSFIDDTIERDIITPLAAILRNGYKIKPVMDKLLKSEHFYDKTVMGVQIKSPIDHVAGLYRELGDTLPPANEVYNHYTEILYNYYYLAATMQQALGDPPNVAGWPAYYQTPQYYQLWTNSDTLPKRVNFSLAMVYGVFIGTPPDILKFASGFGSIADPGAFIDELTEMLYSGFSISSTYKAGLKTATLLSGQAQDYYWTDAWNAYKADPTDVTKSNIVLSRLRSLLDVLLATSEYQLC